MKGKHHGIIITMVKLLTEEEWVHQVDKNNETTIEQEKLEHV